MTIVDCPSILYFDVPDTIPFSDSLIADLKLDSFFTDGAADASFYPCIGTNLSARQQLISALLIPQNREKLCRLLKQAERLWESDNLFAGSRCPAEKYCSFVGLMQEVTAFYHEGASFGLGDPLSDRFALFCREQLSSNEFDNIDKALHAVQFQNNSSYQYTLQERNGELRLSTKASEGIIARLSACAEKLGMTDMPSKSSPMRRLSPDIAEAAAKLEQDRHRSNAAFYEKYASSYCSSLSRYYRELIFLSSLIAFLDMLACHRIPLSFAEPCQVRCLTAQNVYDVSLLAKQTETIVPNDVFFSEEEPFFFLSGANGGGKTTYLRAVGTLCLMHLWGAPLACTSAKIGGISSLFTHFPRDERFDGSGRFAEEHKRVNEILQTADKSSLLLFNETYASTTEENACRMTTELAENLLDKRIFTLYITHQAIKEDNRFSYLHVVVDKDNANRRTYQIARQKNEGGSFAADILKKYRLDKASLKERLINYKEHSVKEETPHSGEAAK